MNRRFARGLAALWVAAATTACAPDSAPDGAAAVEGGSQAAPAAASPAEPAAGDLEALLASADPNRGRVLFLQCRACHSLGEGEPHKVGPNLHGMFGRKAGLAPGFGYSEALLESDIVWSAASVDRWLARPSDFLPGNNMVFIGVKAPEDRAHLIAYLRQETGAAD